MTSTFGTQVEDELVRESLTSIFCHADLNFRGIVVFFLGGHSITITLHVLIQWFVMNWCYLLVLGAIKLPIGDNIHA